MTLSSSAATVFDALGDPNRLRIVITLCDAGPTATSKVAQSIPATRQAATKHLLVLESAGLVGSEKRGRERIWSIRPQSLATASDYLNTLSRRWDNRIDRLRALVEDN
jgi:DNA-binding transcriptional ArsR family regulator